MGFLPSILLVFLTIYIFFALMKITMCFKHLEASHIMSCDTVIADTKAQLSDFKLGKKLF